MKFLVGEISGRGRKNVEKTVGAGRKKDARQGRVKRGGKESLSQCRVGGGD